MLRRKSLKREDNKWQWWQNRHIKKHLRERKPQTLKNRRWQQQQSLGRSRSHVMVAIFWLDCQQANTTQAAQPFLSFFNLFSIFFFSKFSLSLWRPPPPTFPLLPPCKSLHPILSVCIFSSSCLLVLVLNEHFGGRRPMRHRKASEKKKKNISK